MAVRTSRILATAPIWVPDEEASECLCCQVEFGFFKRRHHCRNCGQVVCNACSGRRIRLPQFGIMEASRVCDRCFPSTGNVAPPSFPED